MMEGRLVSLAMTPSNPIPYRSSASTNTSITWTGLSSLTQASRHSGERTLVWGVLPQWLYLTSWRRGALSHAVKRIHRGYSLPPGTASCARSCKDGSAASAALGADGSAATQSPAQSLVPLTVPTNLHPADCLTFARAEVFFPVGAFCARLGPINASRRDIARTNLCICVSFQLALLFGGRMMAALLVVIEYKLPAPLIELACVGIRHVAAFA
jgi:hypothetical protein